MTTGEKMVWAAAFAAGHMGNEEGSTWAQSAVEEMHNRLAVLEGTARGAGPEGQMLREMLADD